jgi:hypothetical protein
MTDFIEGAGDDTEAGAMAWSMEGLTSFQTPGAGGHLAAG